MSVKNLYPSSNPTVNIDYTKTEGFGSFLTRTVPLGQV